MLFGLNFSGNGLEGFFVADSTRGLDVSEK
jgi:hypothetical protein